MQSPEEIVKDMLREDELKENKSTRFKSILFGADSRILSFMIITPENPMGKATDEHQNKILREKFLKEMKELGHPTMSIKGVYNHNKENSFLVLNVSLEDAKKIGYNYDQEAFIFADRENFWDNFIYRYFEKTKKGEYIVKSTVKSISSKEEAEDLFSRFKNFKFSMDFFSDKEIDYDGIYPECVEWYDNYLNEVCVPKEKGYNKLLREQVFGKGFTELHRLRNRHWHLYETKEHKIKMDAENQYMQTKEYIEKQKIMSKRLRELRESNYKYEESRKKAAMEKRRKS